MGKANTTAELELEVSDVSAQKVFKVANAPTDNTVGELIREMVGRMNLPSNDSSGAPLSYTARLERDGGRSLHAQERIGDVLESHDRLTLQPNIDAGLI
jgi:hypothetical protein